MDDGDSLEGHALIIRDKELEILIPALALISCANSRAMELGGGFSWVESGWQLIWPDEVAQGFGLRPSQFQKCNSENDVFKVFFEPFVTKRLSYWSTLFDLTVPALVVGYEASSDEPPAISPTDEECLHWHWHVSDDKKIAAIKKAIAAHKDLEDQVDWVALAMQAGSSGPRSTLFTSVAAHLAHQKP